MSFWAYYPPLLAELVQVEDFMLQATSSRKVLLNTLCHDLIQRGGKRLRPAFLLLSAHYGNYDSHKAIPFAAAIELIHTATLVHDDVIDEASMRRGHTTIHSKWGKDMAIYSGDFLFTKAFLILATHDADKRYLEALARGMQSICEGEVDQYEQKYVVTPVFDYLKRIERKSALLFSISCAMGASSAKCNKLQTKALSFFGTYYGIAFQIRDDLIDYKSTFHEAGKPIGTDLREGNYTLPILFALKDTTYNPLIMALLEKKEKLSDEDIARIIDYVHLTSALPDCMDLMTRFINKAITALDLLPQNEMTQTFRHLCDLLLHI